MKDLQSIIQKVANGVALQFLSQKEFLILSNHFDGDLRHIHSRCSIEIREMCNGSGQA